MSGMESREAQPLCEHCGEVIGMYEPLVMVSREVPVRTSRAALKLDPLQFGEPCFHAECFARREIDPRR